jgi:hypothetical protein
VMLSFDDLLFHDCISWKAILSCNDILFHDGIS